MVFDLTPRLPTHRPLLWPDWILDLQEILAQEDGLPEIYIVGGAARDALLRRPVKDVDLATPTNAIRLARRITDLLNGDIYVMDEERGVARVFFRAPQNPSGAEELLTLDIADFRADSLLNDLLERDFTLNAIAVNFLDDLTRIIDPLNGEADANSHILRRCNPNALASDPIRCLRGVRQSVQLGTRIEPETLADMRRLAPKITDTSPERIRDELFNLLALERPFSGLRVAKAVGVLDAILPTVAALSNDEWLLALNATERLTNIVLAISFRRTEDTAAVFDLGMLVMQFDRYREPLNQYIFEKWPNNRSNRGLLLLATLAYHVGPKKQIASQIADTLRLSAPEKKRLVGYVLAAQVVINMTSTDVLTLHRYWYRWQEAGIGGILIALASARASYNLELQQNLWLQLIDRARALLSAYYDLHDEIVAPSLLVDGHMLKEHLNITDGPIIGELLTLIREGQVTGDVTTPEHAIQLASEHLSSQG
ncbi:MAG: hypothetical protein CL607_13450 [Anaerolineaceae bacterium]|nr:hypothetical protein [Anaerolineaceae bacterium]